MVYDTVCDSIYGTILRVHANIIFHNFNSLDFKIDFSDGIDNGNRGMIAVEIVLLMPILVILQYIYTINFIVLRLPVW